MGWRRWERRRGRDAGRGGRCVCGKDEMRERMGWGKGRGGEGKEDVLSYGWGDEGEIGRKEWMDEGEKKGDEE